jgi:trimethylamine:corrinoid methyltransferase-like protein
VSEKQALSLLSEHGAFVAADGPERVSLPVGLYSATLSSAWRGFPPHYQILPKGLD